MNSNNERGYITTAGLDHKFLLQIATLFSMLGYEDMLLGNTEIPYTMWDNFLFIRLYYLIFSNLRELISMRVEQRLLRLEKLKHLNFTRIDY